MNGAKSTCAACGQVFKSTSEFDKHRRGEYEAGKRYCVDSKDKRIKRSK